jgi:hypothetical protein
VIYNPHLNDERNSTLPSPGQTHSANLFILLQRSSDHGGKTSGRIHNLKATNDMSSIFPSCLSLPIRRLPSVLRNTTFTAAANDNDDDNEGHDSGLDEVEESEVCILPDLGALRFWSHPRRSLDLTMERQQGVVWKRRDVFKNRWRPRWFVLQPGQGVLTYYLLTAPVSTAINSIALPLIPDVSSADNDHYRGTRNVATSASLQPTLRNGGGFNARDRVTSWDSAVSENTLDYDVVPRGTIYLLGCTVDVNDALSRPRDNLFAFTIIPPTSMENKIHLAVRTAEGRSAWINKLARVARVGSPSLIRSISIPEEPDHSFEHEDDEHRLLDRENDLREVDSTTDTVWKSVGSRESLYKELPDALANEIEEKLAQFLPICDQGPTVGWKLIFERDEDAAYRKEDPNSGQTMIKSIALLEHPPKQILDILLDIQRRTNFESTFRTGERLRTLNAHTFLDFYAYNAIWPTAAREFAIAMHWQVVGRDDERAICIIGFSCPDAESVKPVEPHHVRGRLIISMYLLRPVGEGQCHLTRLLSFDPMGGINKHLARIVLQQQAGLPAVLGKFLDRHESVVPFRLTGGLRDDDLVRDVVEHLPKPNSTDAVRGTLDCTTNYSLVLAGSETSRDGIKVDNDDHLPVRGRQAAILIAPLLLYKVCILMGSSWSFPLFCLGVFLAVRQVAIQHLGKVLPHIPLETQIAGPVTCRFSVNLKGILRFIANKKEERTDLRRGTSDVSVVHLVVAAISRALRKEPSLRSKTCTIPWLLIDERVDQSRESVRVSVSENAEGVVTLENVDNLSVQEIADEVKKLDSWRDEAQNIGECLVLATPDFDSSNMEVDVTSGCSEVTVVAVIGGVHLERCSQKGRRANDERPRPMLSLSLTISAPYQTQIVAARRFAEEVQKVLQFPEMCDN